MERRLVLSGGLAGVVAGLLAFVFARIFGEPSIQAAIDYETGRDAAQAKASNTILPDAPELFSRTVQGGIGIGVGVVAFGLAMGVLFAVVYRICWGRVRVGTRALALLVATAGFVSIYLVPFVKYPANPPAVGHDETIRARGNLYLIMVLCSVLLLVAAVLLRGRLAARLGPWNATVVAGLAYLGAVAGAMAMLPSLGMLPANVAQYGRHATETPLPLTDADGRIVFPGFPADVLYSFRLASIGAQALLWMSLGLIFGPLAERVLGDAAPTGPVGAEVGTGSTVAR